MKKMVFIPLTGMLLLSACFALPVEEPVLPPPIIQSFESATYKTVAVARGDVQRYRDLNASYVAAREEALSFTVGDVYIKSIYVEVGDVVQKGDVVAELDREYYVKELANAEQDETWALLKLKQLDERHALDLKEAAVTGEAIDEAAYLDERESLQTQLETIRIRMEYLRFEDERRLLRAGMDGTVTYAMSFREGDTSTADQRVITVTDQSQSVFMVRGSEIEFLHIGEQHELIVNWESFTAEVVDPEILGIARVNSDEAYLMIVDEEQPSFTARTYATLHLILDESKDVLYVPYAAVKKANARSFVYVLVDGVRTIRDIEIGLDGNSLTEVTGGLTEGETVIVD